MMRTSPWRFVGARDAQGQPAEWYVGIPARDLTADDVANLSEEQYAVVAASALYASAQSPKAAKPVATEVTNGN
jgi:hypothetical protein